MLIVLIVFVVIGYLVFMYDAFAGVIGLMAQNQSETLLERPHVTILAVFITSMFWPICMVAAKIKRASENNQ